MGTGIVSILLHNLPYSAGWVYWVSVAFFVLNVVLLVAFTLVSVARYALYPQIWGLMVRHPTQSLFLGTFPMGLATVVNMVVLVGVPAWGAGAAHVAWALWWFDLAAAVLCCVSLPFMLSQTGRLTLASATAALLLPIVPCVVAAASGALVADALPDPHCAALTLAVSYAAWGAGQFFSAMVLAMYVVRLNVHSLPPREAIVSVFLPVGPFGQGGFAILKLGRVTHQTLARFPDHDALPGLPYATLGAVAYGTGVLLALMMWGIGLVWLAYAVISIATTKSFPFNMGWWGFTFPIGVFAVCTAELGTVFPGHFFSVVAEVSSAGPVFPAREAVGLTRDGQALSSCVFLLWIMVATLTLKQALSGDIFVAPCLKDVGTTQKRS